jgi:DhnA family fructose-bisphosphate aldolase class Ia
MEVYMDGKRIKMNRLLNNGRMLCVPLDHGITVSEIGHLADFTNTVEVIAKNGASAIIIHKGLVRFLPPLKNTGIIVHLSASTEKVQTVQKVIVCEVEEAIALGADAVSIHVNLGNDYEKQMLHDFARISKDCQRFGVPLFVMIYIRDNDNKDISTKETERQSIRIAAELGADIVKIGANWEQIDRLKYVIKDALIPVVVAGGEVKKPELLYTSTQSLMKTGLIGVSFGRNVFMSSNIKETMSNLAHIVYESKT